MGGQDCHFNATSHVESALKWTQGSSQTPKGGREATGWGVLGLSSCRSWFWKGEASPKWESGGASKERQRESEGRQHSTNASDVFPPWRSKKTRGRVEEDTLQEEI